MCPVTRVCLSWMQSNDSKIRYQDRLTIMTWSILKFILFTTSIFVFNLHVNVVGSKGTSDWPHVNIGSGNEWFHTFNNLKQMRNHYLNQWWPYAIPQIWKNNHCYLIEAEWCIYSPRKLNIIGSDNGLLLSQRQAIIWTNVGILLVWTLGTIFG